MATKERFNASLFLKFLRRLLRHSDRKVFLIVDRHPVHRSGKDAKVAGKVPEPHSVFFLPAYSPELNPGEPINQDAKTNARQCARNTCAARNGFLLSFDVTSKNPMLDMLLSVKH